MIHRIEGFQKVKEYTNNVVTIVHCIRYFIC